MIDFIVNNWVPIVSWAIIPAVIGLLTRADARPFIKAFLTFLLSVLVGAVEAVQIAGVAPTDFEAIFAYIIGVWTTAHLAYKMAYKPAGNGVNVVTVATPEVGVA
jgi:hypothetical protein